MKGKVIDNQKNKVYCFLGKVTSFKLSSCEGKVNGDFIATTIDEVPASFSKIGNCAKPDLHP